MQCVYCQNKPISRCDVAGEIYTVQRLGEEMLSLAARGAENIDLVSPTQYAAGILAALSAVKPKLSVPVIWNTGGYETVETVRGAGRYVDVFLTDMKYGTAEAAARYSDAPDYPETALSALAAMVEAVGAPVWRGDRLVRGVVVRHLVLPGGRRDSAEALRRMAEVVDPAQVVLSLMRQYTPDFAPAVMSPLNRRVTTFEYEYVRDTALSLGFDGFGQDADSAVAAYTPVWE